MNIYGVVTMDIVGSRHIMDRNKVQNKLISYIAEVNEKFQQILLTPISLTLGDEWQAITNKPSECYNIIHEFQQRLWSDGIECYAGIGMGSISTSIYDDIRKMDGPCFHMARQAIKIAKKQERAGRKYIYSKRNRVFFKSSNEGAAGKLYSIAKMKAHDNPQVLEETAVTSMEYDDITIDDIINILIENNEILKSKMTNKQKKVYMNYLKFGSYRKIIEESQDGNDSIGGISQKLNTAEFFTIQRNHGMVSALLDYFSG